MDPIVYTIAIVALLVGLAVLGLVAFMERKARLKSEAKWQAKVSEMQVQRDVQAAELESQWRQKADEKADMIVREIHHRVKNNFQTVSSLLNLHTRYLKDTESKNVLWEGQNRIKSMALIHTQLYQRDETDAIAIHEYTDTLIKELTFSYNAEGKDIQFHEEVPEMMLPVEVAVPLGLILHELVLNSFKYAFPDNRPGNIWVMLEVDGDTLRLRVRDDGVGLPEGMDPLAVKTSYGMRLLVLFSMELKGKLIYEEGEGTSVVFECPAP